MLPYNLRSSPNLRNHLLGGVISFYERVPVPVKWPCKGACLAVWRPLVLPKGQAKPVAGKGMTGLGAVRGPSLEQVTWHGRPLYTFVRDHKGSVLGQGIVQDGTWYVAQLAAPKATNAKTTAKKTTTPPATSKSSGGSSW
jgi:hypothetical protein